MFLASLASGYEVGFWLLFIQDYCVPRPPLPTPVPLGLFVGNRLMRCGPHEFPMVMAPIGAQTFLSTVLFLPPYLATLLLLLTANPKEF